MNVPFRLVGLLLSAVDYALLTVGLRGARDDVRMDQRSSRSDQAWIDDTLSDMCSHCMQQEMFLLGRAIELARKIAALQFSYR